ncbi:MAG: SelB C-terminal domain-containing protein [Planctomycetales bacterium]|nr:SelB C-terminal domain-containing protein [Planctomycetales bacterium]
MLQQLISSKQLVALSPSGQRQLLVPAALLDDYADRVAAVLSKWHDQSPLKSRFDRSKLIHEFAYLGDPLILQTVLQRMERSKRVRLSDRYVGLADRGPQLSKNEQQLFDQIVELYQSARFQPPTVKECEQQLAAKNPKVVKSLISLAASDGILIEFGDQMYLHADRERELRQIMQQRLAVTEGLTVSEIREALETSRKFAVPLCEYLDRIGFTQRSGDLRRLSPSFADKEIEATAAAGPNPRHE